MKCNHITSCKCKATTPLQLNPEAEKTKGKEERNSHHTGRASPRCGSSCARPGLASDWKPCYTRSTGTASPARNDNSEWKWANTEPRSLQEWNSMLHGASFIFSPRYYSQWKQQKTTFKWLSESWESCSLTASTSAPTYELIIRSSPSDSAIWGTCFLSQERYRNIKFQCSFLYPPKMLKAHRQLRLSTETSSLSGDGRGCTRKARGSRKTYFEKWWQKVNHCRISKEVQMATKPSVFLLELLVSSYCKTWC